MSIRKEQSKRICRIIDNYLSNRPGERDELIAAIQKAFEALDKDTNVPTKEDAIPMEWIGEYLVWLKGIGGYGLSDARAIQSMIIKWKMDNPQKHSGCGPDYCEIGG